MKVREVALVGNAPPRAGVAAEIDAADHVVRFNKARGFGGATGSRIDDLFLVNCGGQMREWLEDAAFWTSPPVSRAAQVTLPIPAHGPTAGLTRVARGEPLDGINFERDARARLAGHPGRIFTLPAEAQAGAIHALRALGASPERWPSTGFLALFWYDRVLPPSARITLHGFTFRGYEGHPWPQERAWAEARARSGRVRLRMAQTA